MNRIKELRLLNGWRQDDLAERMHTKKNTISRYETGERNIDAGTINALCDIFGCTADYLLGRSSSPDAVISDDDAGVLHAYHAATPEIRAIIDAALAPYREGDTMSSTA